MTQFKDITADEYKTIESYVKTFFKLGRSRKNVFERVVETGLKLQDVLKEMDVQFCAEDNDDWTVKNDFMKLPEKYKTYDEYAESFAKTITRDELGRMLAKLIYDETEKALRKYDYAFFHTTN